MGYYINPSDGSSKESWLEKHGEPLSLLEVKEFDFNKGSLPVCLVDNGDFTAAGIAYDSGEKDYFLDSSHDSRPKAWFSVKKDLLKEWYDRD
jgi:hypothetical protein